GSRAPSDRLPRRIGQRIGDRGEEGVHLIGVVSAAAHLLKAHGPNGIGVGLHLEPGDRHGEVLLFSVRPGRDRRGGHGPSDMWLEGGCYLGPFGSGSAPRGNSRLPRSEPMSVPCVSFCGMRIRSGIDDLPPTRIWQILRGLPMAEGYDLVVKPLRYRERP